jgi:hypothetical protein
MIRLYLAILPGLFCWLAHGQPAQLAFQQIIQHSTPCDLHPAEMLQTQDGGYMITGTTECPNPSFSNHDIFLIRADAFGNVQWSQKYEGASDDIAQSLCRLENGNYVIGGISNSFGGIPLIYLIKTDASGNMKWSKTISIPTAVGHGKVKVRATQDGGFVIAAHVQFSISFSIVNQDIMVIKLDSSGAIQWEQKVGHAVEWETLGDIEALSAGGYIIAAKAANQTSSSFSDALIIRLDSSGNILWYNQYGSSNGHTEAFDIVEAASGVVFTGILNEGLANTIACKLDNGGALVWAKQYGANVTNEPSISTGIKETLNGGYAISGWSFPTSAFRYKFLTKVNGYGDLEWSHYYNADYFLPAFQLQGDFVETSDGGFAFLSEAEWNNGAALYHIKTDSKGESGCYSPGFAKQLSDPQISIKPTTQLAAANALPNKVNVQTTLSPITFYSESLCSNCVAPSADFIYTPNGLTVSFSDFYSYGTGYYWDFGDGNFSNSSMPVHTYSNGGIYNVCLNVINPCGSASICKTITSTNLLAFPNPFTQEVSVQFQTWKNADVSVEIFDFAGTRRRFYTTVSSYDGWNTIKINESDNLPPGVHLFRVNVDNVKQTIRIIKQ